MLERAKFIIGESKAEVKVMFNPESYSVESSIQFTESSAIYKGIGVMQFQKISPRTMSVELYFDTLNGPPFSMTDLISQAPLPSELAFIVLDDVTEYTNKFQELVQWDSQRNCTPIVTFSWGHYSFEGVITKIAEKFTMFRPDGAPVRANLTVSMTEYNEQMARAAGMAAAAAAATAAVPSTGMTDVTTQQKEAAKAVAKSLV